MRESVHTGAGKISELMKIEVEKLVSMGLFEVGLIFFIDFLYYFWYFCFVVEVLRCELFGSSFYVSDFAKD